YMSPEQARAEPVDARSDLWSLAVVAFEMITGVPPFTGKSMWDVMMKICGDERLLPSVVAPFLPPESDAFFARALASKPSDRFESARAFADGFAALASARPGSAPLAAVTSPRVGTKAAPLSTDSVAPTATTQSLTSAMPTPGESHDVGRGDETRSIAVVEP